MRTILVRPTAILLLATTLPAVAPALRAQEPPDTLADPDTFPGVMDLGEIVVVGTRCGGRTAIESYSPVHVVSGASVRAQGGADLPDLLLNRPGLGPERVRDVQRPVHAGGVRVEGIGQPYESKEFSCICFPGT